MLLKMLGERVLKLTLLLRKFEAIRMTFELQFYHFYSIFPLLEVMLQVIFRKSPQNLGRFFYYHFYGLESTWN